MMMSLVITMAKIKTSSWRQGELIERKNEYECSGDKADLALTNYLAKGYYPRSRVYRKAAILHKHYPDGTHSQIYIEF